MSSSLRDQLLKAGLVDENRLKSEKKARHQRRKEGKQNADRAAEEERVRAERRRREKAQRDRKINLEHERRRERKAAHAQIRELIEANRLDRNGAEIAYHFVHRGKVKKLYVTPQMQRDLVAGSMAVVRLDGRHELVRREVAEKILERDDSFVMVINEPAVGESAPPADDPYAGYEVPDDLVW